MAIIDYLHTKCRDVQFMLRRIGYSCYVTGHLDDRTVRCVKAFQRDLRLPYHGRVDAATMTKLQRCFDNWR